MWTFGKKHVYVHILVANSFFSSATLGQKITHLDNNKRNNSVRNLDILGQKIIEKR